MVKVKEDLTGQRFGKLTVIEQAEDYVKKNGEREPRWKCKCDCGNFRVTSKRRLLSNPNISCGCSRKKHNQEIKVKEDLTGQKFNKLTVIGRDTDYVSPNGNKTARWKCLCECGNICSVYGTRLHQGITKSCGCLRKISNGIKPKDDLSGNKYGRLTVIKQVDDIVNNKGHHITMWLCKCDCGNEKIVRGSNLKSGNSQSCGCTNRENNKKALYEANHKENIYEFYDNYGIVYDEQKLNYWIFDLNDYDKLKNIYWSSGRNGYATGSLNGTTVQMARYIMNIDVSDKRYVDHLNHNINDNRKTNLRICTPSQNNMNRSFSSNNKSGVIGVCWDKAHSKWSAQIGLNKKTIHLGLFENFEDAVKSRKNAEEEYFGEYSYDNSIKKESDIVDIL